MVIGAALKCGSLFVTRVAAGFSRRMSPYFALSTSLDNVGAHPYVVSFVIFPLPLAEKVLAADGFCRASLPVMSFQTTSTTVFARKGHFSLKAFVP